MGIPPLQLSFALVVFVLTPEGRIATIGGQELTQGHVMGPPRRGLTIAGLVKDHMDRILPAGTITSRLRPLMPRLGRDGRVVVPLWATGRLPNDAEWAGLGDRTEPRRHDALERLADQLQDESLIDEAHSEFRRALASDPVSHQLMSESGRLRALAMDELDWTASREDGIPPVFGLLPERFTIEQLQLAVTQAARLHPGDIQKSSNFRRRLVELTELGVLEKTSDTAASEVRGRPPQMFRFNRARWLAWLETRRGDARPGSARRWELERQRDFLPSMPDAAMAFMRPLRSPGIARRSMMAAPTPPRPDDRVERLEGMMRAMMNEIADLRKAAPQGRQGEQEQGPAGS